MSIRYVNDIICIAFVTYLVILIYSILYVCTIVYTITRNIPTHYIYVVSANYSISIAMQCKHV